MTYLPAWREHLERELTAYAAMLAEAVALGRADAPIRSCPGWSVRDLTGHLIEVQHWAVANIEAGDPSQVTGGSAPELPGDEELGLAFASSAHRLLAALDRDAGAPCWGFGAERNAGFWQRRQPHEHAIHRWDLEAALHGSAGLEEELALDGIDEVVTMFWPRQVRLGRTEAPADALRLRADTGDVWVIGDPRPEAPEQEPVAEVTGTVSELALLLWGRQDPTTLAWKGDQEAGIRVLDRPLTP
ncbi:MAG: maleylpyruvate isomerase family mycothiol-dependent enzyme [Nocardioides sp.]|jgi:uncharacterized protein (TIGR03083 family)